MAELERLANHFGDIGAICNDASFSLMHAHCGALREHVLRAADTCFGHRLMMDRVVPGGDGRRPRRRVDRAHPRLDRRRAPPFPELVELYDNTASLQDRTVTTGIVTPELARQYGCRRLSSAAPRGAPSTPARTRLRALRRARLRRSRAHEGDVDARVWIRMREIEQSLGLIEQIIDRLAPGPDPQPPAADSGEAGEGVALVEGFRGDVLAGCGLAATAACARATCAIHRWFQWPLLEAAIEGNIVADFPLCNKSFNCSYSGHDL